MAPAHQGFHAVHVRGGHHCTIRVEALQAHLRLIRQQQLFAVECAAQVGLHAQAATGLLVHLGCEACGSILAAVLGVVHRRIGIAREGLHITSVMRIQAHAHAGRDVDLVQIQRKRRRQRRENALGQAIGKLGSVRRGNRCAAGQFGNDGELVSPNAAQHGAQVGLLNHLVQAARHLAQQAVAIVVAQRVVDHLEVVEIQQQQANRPRLSCTLERNLQSFVEGVPVRQLRHRVDVGEIVQVGFGLQHRAAHAGTHQIGDAHGANAHRHRQHGVAQQLHVQVDQAGADHHVADHAALGLHRFHHLQRGQRGDVFFAQHGGIGRTHGGGLTMLVQRQRLA